jgi:hypothetical protein
MDGAALDVREFRSLDRANGLAEDCGVDHSTRVERDRHACVVKLVTISPSELRTVDWCFRSRWGDGQPRMVAL